MKRSNRYRDHALLSALAGGAALLMAGCGDDNGPQAVSLSVAGISQEVQNMLTLAQLSDAFNSLGDLSNTITPVMGPASPVPSRVPSGRDVSEVGTEQIEPSSLSFRLAPPEATMAVSAASVAFLFPPLGVTCIWAGTGWAGGQALFGPVPQDQTFFELYETESNGLPADPPVPLSGSAFVSVRPGIQDPPSTIDVTTFVEQSSQRVFEATTTGTVTGVNIFDVDIRDGSFSDGTNALGFQLNAQADSRQTDLDFGNLTISESVTLDVAADAWVVSITALCPTCNSDNVSFDFRTTRTAPFTIISGDVFVDDTSVAQLSGTLTFPTATVTSDSGLSTGEASLLGGILVGMSQVTSAVALVADFESCVGSGSAQFCGAS